MASPKCDGCGTESANCYYIPRGYGGLCLCPQCEKLLIYFGYSYDNKELMKKELKFVLNKKSPSSDFNKT